jgi:hypothetical protein
MFLASAYGFVFQLGLISYQCLPQVAAWVPYIVSNFYLVENHKIYNNSTLSEARQTRNTDLESLEF